MRREEFRWSCGAHRAKTALLEGVILEFNRASVLTRLARDLRERIQSPRSALASTTPGRHLDGDKSENPNGTKTPEPALGVTMPRPLRHGSSLRPSPPR